jgi:CDGSH iron-sulfur domain-containing protein 3
MSSSYPPLRSKIDPFIPLDQDPDYKPKTADAEKIKNYKSIDPAGDETHAHLRDKMMPEPIVHRPPKNENKQLSGDDISDFPQTEIVPLPESIPYPEGSYRPPSIPVVAGYYPVSVYLYRGKKYDWCSCGHSWNNPFCNGQCKFILTRCRPISFNVSESGYYKLCNCKLSANAPFCNGTEKLLARWALKSHKGFFHWTGYASFFAIMAYWGLNWYH